MWLDKENNVIEKPIAPVVNTDYMTPVVWSDTESKFVDAKTGETWYDYKAGSGTADNTKSMWANVEGKPTASSEASYFVWIPRYAYRITYYNNADLTAYTNSTGYASGIKIYEVVIPL